VRCVFCRTELDSVHWAFDGVSEHPALTLLDRVRWFRPVQMPSYCDVHALDEAALI